MGVRGGVTKASGDGGRGGGLRGGWFLPEVVSLIPGCPLEDLGEHLKF